MQIPTDPAERLELFLFLAVGIGKCREAVMNDLFGTEWRDKTVYELTVLLNSLYNVDTDNMRVEEAVMEIPKVWERETFKSFADLKGEYREEAYEIMEKMRI